MAKKQSKKPELHVLKGSEITFESLMKLYEQLTGREGTPEELEEAKREWDRTFGAEKKRKPNGASAVPKRRKKR